MMKSEGFIDAIHQYIRYWDRQNDRTSKEKMEGLAHSILCLLDGVSGQWHGNIDELCEEGRDFLLHDMLYKDDDEDWGKTISDIKGFMYGDKE